MPDAYTSELESRYATIEGAEAWQEWRAKYKKADRDKMAKSGQAMGDGSYPVADESDLKKAIKAVGRGNADHDTIRKHIIARAKALKLSSLIPDNWNADGSLKETNSVWSTLEERATYADLNSQLQSAISDTIPKGDDGTVPYVWVQDFTDDWAVYQYNGDLLQVPYTSDADNNITLGEPVKVRQITTYAPTEQNASRDLEKRRRAAESLGGTGSGRGMERRTYNNCGPLEVRGEDADTGTVRVAGYASVFDRPYSVGSFDETIKRNAFKKSLNDGAQVVFLANHTGLPMASTANDTLHLSEDSVGLRMEADLDPEDPDSAAVIRKIRRGDLSEMSFAFQAIKQDWNEDYTQRNLTEVSINRGDVSVVTFGASPHTSITTRGALEDFERDAVRFAATLVTEIRDEQRKGATISSATTERLQSVLDLVATADMAVDQAQVELSDLMGVDNPDAPDEAALKAKQAEAAKAVATTPGATGKSDATADTMPTGSKARAFFDALNEYRDGTPQDDAVMALLVQGLECIFAAKKAQLADPDNATDVVDGEVWSHLEDACAAMMKAIVDQAKDEFGEEQEKNAAPIVFYDYRSNQLREMRNREAERRVGGK